MYTIRFVSESDGSTQSYRVSAMSQNEALAKFARIFPNTQVVSVSAN